jgi:hypothetical protein
MYHVSVGGPLSLPQPDNSVAATIDALASAIARRIGEWAN